VLPAASTADERPAFGQGGDDVFQIIPDALPFLTGTEQTFIPTYNDEMFGGAGEDQVLFLGGDLDDLGKDVPDFVSLRYNRFLHRYEFTIWMTRRISLHDADPGRSGPGHRHERRSSQRSAHPGCPFPARAGR
jgi:hypothetical protein